MLLANFNLANMCTPLGLLCARLHVSHSRARAYVFGGINFDDLVKNLPIHQIKIPAKVSGYTVCPTYIETVK